MERAVGLIFVNIKSSSAYVEGRARQNERLGLWSEQLGSSSSILGARLPVLKRELVRVSDWAHGASSWARLHKF